MGDYGDLSVRFSRHNGTVVVDVIGELDVVTAPALAQALAGVVEDQGSMAVQLELGEMAFIDSTGLSVLAAALRRLREKGGELTLANLRPPTLKVFDIVGFTRIFNIVAEPATGAEQRHAATTGPHTLRPVPNTVPEGDGGPVGGTHDPADGPSSQRNREIEKCRSSAANAQRRCRGGMPRVIRPRQG